MSHITAEQFGSHLDHSKPTDGSVPRTSASARSRLAVISALCLPLVLISGCAPSPPPPRARSIAASIAEKMPILRTPQQNVPDDRRRFKDAPVYIDGRRVGVIRPLEVPGNLKPRMRTRPGAKPAPRYSIAEYIAAAGGDLSKIREIHLYGGRARVSVIAGDELRKHKEDLFFLFTGGARGKPRIGWPPEGIRTNASIDLVQAVAVYQDREPPIFDEKEGVMRFADRKPIDGIPYAPAEELKGTRFYSDGVLVGWMKRKTLPNAMLIPGADLASGQFSLTAFVASLGVDPKKVRGIELIQDDDPVAHLEGSALVREPPLVFTMPRRSQGNLVLWLPPSVLTAATPGQETLPVRVSAIQLFLKTSPPKRTYAKAADLVEKEGDRDRDRREPGSKADQGDSESP